jgi:hypothetical protein
VTDITPAHTIHARQEAGMLNAVFVLVGAVAAWLAVDHLLSRRRRAAWSELSANRGFHSTGWEETVAPPEAIEPLPQVPRR